MIRLLIAAGFCLLLSDLVVAEDVQVKPDEAIALIAEKPSQEPVNDLSSQLSTLKSASMQGSAATIHASEPTSYFDMFVGLLLVLALILMLGWLTKRFNLNLPVSNRTLKLDAALALGNKEKIAIVIVDGRRLLLGITPQSIRLLTELDNDLNEANLSKTNQESISFAQQIKQVLKQESNDA